MEMEKMKNWLTGLALLLFAVTVTASSPGPEKWLNVDEPVIEGNFVVLNFNVPYGGVAEFRLFDDAENMVWRGQNIVNPGPNSLKLKTSAFEAGKSYIIQINYKREETQKKIFLPK